LISPPKKSELKKKEKTHIEEKIFIVQNCAHVHFIHHSFYSILFYGILKSFFSTQKIELGVQVIEISKSSVLKEISSKYCVVASDGMGESHRTVNKKENQTREQR
jgi:hypothetical protein